MAGKARAPKQAVSPKAPDVIACDSAFTPAFPGDRSFNLLVPAKRRKEGCGEGRQDGRAVLPAGQLCVEFLSGKSRRQPAGEGVTGTMAQLSLTAVSGLERNPLGCSYLPLGFIRGACEAGHTLALPGGHQ